MIFLSIKGWGGLWRLSFAFTQKYLFLHVAAAPQYDFGEVGFYETASVAAELDYACGY